LLGRFLGHNPSPVSFDQLPAAVQNTVRAQAGTAPIQSLSQVNTNGQTAYLVTFNRNGQDVNLQIDPTGRILTSQGVIGQSRPSLPTPPVSQFPTAAQNPFQRTSIPDWRTAPIRQPLAQASPMDFASLPQGVRDTLMSYAGPGAIDNVQMGRVDGQISYQARLQTNGQPIDLRVSDTGVLLNDQVNDRFLSEYRTQRNPNESVGRPPTWQSGQSAFSSATAALSNTTSVSFNQVPLAVQTTLSGVSNGAPLDRVTQGTLDGRTVYEVTLNKDGQWPTERVAEDGSLLSSPPPAR